MPEASPIIVLLTVNDHETHAVLEAFAPDAPLVSRRGVDYFDLGQHGGNQVYLTISEMGSEGIGAAMQCTQDAIEHWQPQAVIAVGIAFGIDEAKQQIGDVLISNQLQGYELGRLNEDGSFTPRGDKAAAANRLLNRVRMTDVRQQRQAGTWPKLHKGLLLSGQKLVDNLDYRASLHSVFKEAIGGEMEGSGLYASAARSKVDWLVVKAICDWGHHKNRIQKEEWQQLAAANAARVVWEMLRVPGLYVDEVQPVLSPSSPSFAIPPAPVPTLQSPLIVRDAPCPPWALARRGGQILLPLPWGAAQWVEMQAESRQPQVLCRAEKNFPKLGALQITDFVLKRDNIGLLVEMTLSKALQQTFRYICPDTFLMGSPWDETDREEDEAQHLVQISSGFWLAEAAFTQAWWQALMGRNPSLFQQGKGGGPEHPVENINWLEVQACLRKLADLLPEGLPSLPTEAEWEYACRAGRGSAFSFGDNINPEQVNYDGNYPYKNAAKGQYREKTVAVKALPANDWGLYQMHGNVWEWCADSYEENLGQGLVEDPGLKQALAPALDDEGRRVLRGGSWDGHSRSARAAYRLGYRPGRQHDDIGWRMALRLRRP